MFALRKKQQQQKQQKQTTATTNRPEYRLGSQRWQHDLETGSCFAVFCRFLQHWHIIMHHHFEINNTQCGVEKPKKGNAAARLSMQGCELQNLRFNNCRYVHLSSRRYQRRTCQWIEHACLNGRCVFWMRTRRHVDGDADGGWQRGARAPVLHRGLGTTDRPTTIVVRSIDSFCFCRFVITRWDCFDKSIVHVKNKYPSGQKSPSNAIVPSGALLKGNFYFIRYFSWFRFDVVCDEVLMIGVRHDGRIDCKAFYDCLSAIGVCRCKIADPASDLLLGWVTGRNR